MKGGDYSEEDRLAYRKKLDSILAVCPTGAPQSVIDNVYKALEVAMEAHKGIARKSGGWYIEHPLEVARIVVEEMGLSYLALTCALLHDVVEDSEITNKEIEQMFSREVAEIVDGLTKIKTRKYDTESMQADSIAKTLKTIPKNIRVIYIKIADRMHNMRTIESMKPEQRSRSCIETLFIYAPLAHVFGLYTVKRELEDLAFKNLQAEKYEQIKLQTEKLKNEQEEIYFFISETVNKYLKESGVRAKVIKLTKSLYSVYTRMESAGDDLQKVPNFQSIRIVFDPSGTTDERTQAFIILAGLTRYLNAQMGSLRDLILHPSRNNFRALIFKVMGNHGDWIELQICSREMHQIAMHGFPIEHPETIQKVLKDTQNWRNIIDELITDEDNSFSLLDKVREAIVSSQIYAYTPKGEMRKLQKGATVLDFAYLIHTDLGNRFLGAEVNKQNAGPMQVLNTGDTVKIITSNKVSPKRVWLKWVITSKAQTSINRYLRESSEKSKEKGKTIFDAVCNRHHRIIDRLFMDKIVRHFGGTGLLDFYSFVGNGLISKAELHTYFKTAQSIGWSIPYNPDSKKRTYSIRKNGESRKSDRFNPKQLFDIIENEGDEANDYTIASCCNPVPGDQAMAYKSSNGEIIVHAINCENAMRLFSTDKTKTAVVQWFPHRETTFASKISVIGSDRPNLVAEITQIVSGKGNLNMRAISFSGNNGTFSGNIEMFVNNRYDLEKLIAEIRKIEGVQSVVRITQF